jgi:hypothetical protein
MTRRLAFVVIACLACASSRRLERTQALTPEMQELFARYRQFMTEGQMDRFLELPTDTARKQFVDDLKIDDLLSQFPKPVQDAIWAQRVTLGMTKPAVLLSWGGPLQRDFDEDQLSKGNTVERWWYKRNEKSLYVTFTNDVVSDYNDGETSK